MVRHRKCDAGGRWSSFAWKEDRRFTGQNAALRTNGSKSAPHLKCMKDLGQFCEGSGRLRRRGIRRLRGMWPRNRWRPSSRMRSRWAKSISTFFRSFLMIALASGRCGLQPHSAEGQRDSARAGNPTTGGGIALPCGNRVGPLVARRPLQDEQTARQERQFHHCAACPVRKAHDAGPAQARGWRWPRRRGRPPPCLS